MDLLAGVIEPSGLAYVLFLGGLALGAAIPRARALSWWLLVASGGVTFLFSSGMVATALMSPLEYSEPQLDSTAASTPDTVVVLTGWASDDPNLPLSARMNGSSLYRSVYALELHRSRPNGRVIVSGGKPAARIMGETLIALGVPRSRLLIDEESPSTAASAAAIRTILGDEPFLLVTSAGHMPRTLGAMRNQGLAPVAAPTDYQLPMDWWRAEAKPSPFGLSVSDLATHEYLGLLWYRFRGLL